MNKGGRRASRGFNPGVGAYFTVGGPISRRQSEPTRIHHRVTPRNNLLGHGDRLSKPSYLFISPRARSVTPVFFPPSRNTATVSSVASSRLREALKLRENSAGSSLESRDRQIMGVYVNSSFPFFS